jgi:DNA repair exonuclease SbcCD ATPase subunit
MERTALQGQRQGTAEGAGRGPGCDVGQVAGSPCPVCDAPLQQEHAHTRCHHCGWLGKCCE